MERNWGPNERRGVRKLWKELRVHHAWDQGNESEVKKSVICEKFKENRRD